MSDSEAVQDVAVPNFQETIMQLAVERGASKTLCPSEVARAIGGKDERVWRQYMKPIRAVAVKMALSGEIEIKRKGRTVDPQDFKGVYRISLAPSRT